MANANKTDRKKLVSTEVYGSSVVFHRAETGEEFARVNTASLDANITAQLLAYGVKQIVGDIVAGVDTPEKKIEGMIAAVESLRNGVWPRRTPAPATLEPAIRALMTNMKIDRNKALEMLGLPQEG